MAGIEKLHEKFDAFTEQYERDMRGDNNPNSENKGIVGSIRDLNEYQEKYPSLTWLWAHETRRVLTIAGVVIIMVSAIASSDWLPSLGQLAAAVFLP